MLKKNDRVAFEGKMGTVVGNSYKVHGEDDKVQYCEVWLDGGKHVETIRVDALTLVD